LMKLLYYWHRTNLALLLPPVMALSRSHRTRVGRSQTSSISLLLWILVFFNDAKRSLIFIRSIVDSVRTTQWRVQIFWPTNPGKLDSRASSYSHLSLFKRNTATIQRTPFVTQNGSTFVDFDWVYLACKVSLDVFPRISSFGLACKGFHVI
jgi:hypothetical protein